MADLPKQLQKGTCVYEVALRKDWSKTPSYWIKLYKVPVQKLTFWYVLRLWKFKKGSQRELVEGNAIFGDRCRASETAADCFKSAVAQKTEDQNWIIHSSSVPNPAEAPNNLLKALKEPYESTYNQEAHWDEPSPKKKTSKFAQAVAKRRKKAQW